MRAIGYVRVSTEEQAVNGNSLGIQREKIGAMAALQDADLLDVIVDDASARNLNRPGMQHVLNMVKSREVDAVIVYKLDRLTRSVRDLGGLLERFDKANVSLVSVSESLDTGTAAGRLVLNVMGSVAQWERETTVERTREALQAKRARGERTGNIPYGYQLAEDGTHLEQEPGEQRILSGIQRYRKQGLSGQAIADRLNARGLKTRRGGQWHRQYVYNLLRRFASK